MRNDNMLHVRRDFGKLPLVDGNFATKCFERAKECYFPKSEEENHGQIGNKLKRHHHWSVRKIKGLRQLVHRRDSTT